MLSRKPLDFRHRLVILHECSAPCQKQLFAYIPTIFIVVFQWLTLYVNMDNFFLVLRKTQRPSSRLPCQQIWHIQRTVLIRPVRKLTMENKSTDRFAKPKNKRRSNKFSNIIKTVFVKNSLSARVHLSKSIRFMIYTFIPRIIAFRNGSIGFSYFFLFSRRFSLLIGLVFYIYITPYRSWHQLHSSSFSLFIHRYHNFNVQLYRNILTRSKDLSLQFSPGDYQQKSLIDLSQYVTI